MRESRRVANGIACTISVPFHFRQVFAAAGLVKLPVEYTFREEDLEGPQRVRESIDCILRVRSLRGAAGGVRNPQYSPMKTNFFHHLTAVLAVGVFTISAVHAQN